MKKFLLLIVMSLLFFMACDQPVPEEEIPLSMILIDRNGYTNIDDDVDIGGGINIGSGILDTDGTLDGDFSDDGDNEWSGGINLGSGILDTDGKLDGDFSDDGDNEWGGRMNIDHDLNEDGTQDWGNAVNVPGLPKWAIGDKRTIKIEEDMPSVNMLKIDYNDNLTSELDPTRAVFMNTIFFKEAGNATKNANNISVLINSASEPTSDESDDPYSCLIYREFSSGMNPDDNNQFLHLDATLDKASPFLIEVTDKTVVISNTAIRVSISIQYKFISPTTGNEERINYVWKGSFTPQFGIHELQLVGYSVNGKDIGDANPYSAYVPI